MTADTDFSPPPSSHALTSGAEEEQRLLSVVTHLELELGRLKSELSSWQHLKSSCEEVHSIHGKASWKVSQKGKERLKFRFIKLISTFSRTFYLLTYEMFKYRR